MHSGDAHMFPSIVGKKARKYYGGVTKRVGGETKKKLTGGKRKKKERKETNKPHTRGWSLQAWISSFSFCFTSILLYPYPYVYCLALFFPTSTGLGE